MKDKINSAKRYLWGLHLPKDTAYTKDIETAYIKGAEAAEADQYRREWIEVDRDREGYTTREAVMDMNRHLPILIEYRNGEYAVIHTNEWSCMQSSLMNDNDVKRYMPIL